ncbi:MAG TPA: hypothetical protein VML91_21590 [Burkholderiales bacterium]|nr:hypothetical protein [Burkholderiales bacterium]
MGDKSLSDKERALLHAARREVAAKVKRREVVDTAALAGSSAHRGSAAAPAPRREAPRLSPLDAQTVLGWDHPAAQKPASAAADKWARIATLMEEERREAAEKRAKARRGAIIFLVCVFFVVLIAGARALMR